MQDILFGFAAWIVLDALLTIGFIGKPRKPTTPGLAVFMVVVCAIEVYILIVAGMRL